MLWCVMCDVCVRVRGEWLKVYYICVNVCVREWEEGGHGDTGMCEMC